MSYTARTTRLYAAVLFLLACLLLLAGCGADPSDGAASPASGSAGTSAGEASKPSEAASSAGSESPTAGSEQAATRKVTDAFGEKELPARPERIVVLTTAALDNLLSLGVKPIGAPFSIAENKSFFKHLSGQTDGIENIGTVDQPNLEAIAKLKPDLIIGQKADHEAIHEDLQRIAPTYMTEENVDKWKTAFLGHADAVNLSREGEAKVAEFNGRIAELRAKIEALPEIPTVTLIRPRADHIRIHLDGSYSGSIVAESGLLFPEQQRASQGAHHIQISEEQIGDMDADVILSFGREHEAEFFEQKIKTNPLWNTLKAVRNEQVHALDWETWLSGQGIQAAHLIVDDLQRLFLP